MRLLLSSILLLLVSESAFALGGNIWDRLFRGWIRDDQTVSEKENLTETTRPDNEIPKDLIDALRIQYKDVPDRDDHVNNSVIQLFSQMKKVCEEENKCEPLAFEEDVWETAEGLYQGGYITVDARTKFIVDVMKLTKMPSSDILNTNKLRWIARYRDHTTINDFKSYLISKSHACVSEGQISNVKPCCLGPELKEDAATVFSLRSISQELPASCHGKKAPGATCGHHSQCCSQICMGLDSAHEVGVCASIKVCTSLVSLGGTCDLNSKPYCERGRCIEENWDAAGSGNCKAKDLQCSQDIDCCSNKCQSGKCVENRKCAKCTPMLGTPVAGEPCCPGTIHNTELNRCDSTFPPLVIPAGIVPTSSMVPNIINSIFNIIFPSAMAAETPAPPAESTPGGFVHNLSPEQEQELIDDMKLCRDLLKADQTKEAEECNARINDKKQQMIAQNIAGGTGQSNLATMSAEEYAARYQIPGITASTESNVENCTFNSWADQWISSTNLERNAEVAVRGYEVAFSGKVTDDYQWLPTSQKMLNEALKGIMQGMRNARVELSNSLGDRDIQLFCDCISLQGEDKLELTAEQYGEPLSAEDVIARNEKRKQIWQGEKCQTSRELRAALLATIEQDGGSDMDGFISTGIPGLQMLINLANERAIHHMTRMEKHIELEDQLKSILDDIDQVEWEKSRRHEVKLYSFVTWEWSGWLLVVIAVGLAIVSITLSVVTFGAAAPGVMVAYIAILILIFVNANDGRSPGWRDVKTRERNLFFKNIYYWDRYANFWVYDSNADDGAPANRKCKVHGFRYNCIKNFYATELDDEIESQTTQAAQDYKQWWQNYKDYRLLDLWLPAFYPSEQQDYFRENFFYTNTLTAALFRGVVVFALPEDGADLRFITSPDFEAEYNKFAGADVSGNKCIEKPVRIINPLDSENRDDGSITGCPINEYEFYNVNYDGTNGMYLAGIPQNCLNAPHGPTYTSQANYCAARKQEFESFQKIRDTILAYGGIELFRHFPESELPLRGTKPNGRKRESWRSKNPIDVVGPYLFPNFTRMEDPSGGVFPIIDSSGAPMQRYTFDQLKINAYKAAVKKYALCDKLKECGYTGDESNIDDLIGFSRFFQTEADADAFASYVYQMHFLWPKMSSHGKIGYPTIGLRAYLENMLLQLQILGSSAAVRSNGYFEYADLLQQRLDEANQWFSNFYSKQMAGNKSQNVEFMNNARAKVKAVVLSAQAFQGSPDYNKANIDYQLKDGQIAGINLQGVDPKTQKFISHLAQSRKRHDQYMSTFGQTKRGKHLTSKVSNFLSRFNNPLAKASQAVTGGLDNKSVSGLASAGQSSDAKAADGATIINNFGLGAGNQSPYGTNIPYGAGMNGYSKSSSSGSGAGVVNTGLSDIQLKKMLDSSKHDETLREFDPLDTIFTVISKAYKRNLDRVLTPRTYGLEQSNEKKTPKPKEIKDEKKKELMNLLEE